MKSILNFGLIGCSFTFVSAQQCVRDTVTSVAPLYVAENKAVTGSLVSDPAEFVTLGMTEATFDNAKNNCPYMGADLQDWHDASVWGGAVPSAGSAVTLPENTKILISSCSLLATADNPYRLITIPETSELIFNDAAIHLHTTGMEVKGKLVMGAENCRLNDEITITLYGTRAGRTASLNYKGIAVTGNGVLDVHGAHFHPTWTRLAQTAMNGTNTLFLQDSVNWDVGSQIVLTGTEIKDTRDWHRNEVVTITRVYNNAVEFEPALKYIHYGGKEYQAEVGLLTRRIKIEGSESDSEPTDNSPSICDDDTYSSYPCANKFLTGFGGHIIISGDRATGRAESVELYRMGQTNVLARYPFHFHFLGESGSDSYITGSSVHKSYFRCFTVHATNNTLVADNVAYDAIGHCYYLEDGVEEKNTFNHNLASHIHIIGYPQSGGQTIDDVTETNNLINPADVTAAGFYITNPYNTYTGNAASGGAHGYSFVRVPTPLRLSKDNPLVPEERPTLEFDGNSCHSAGFYWSQAGCIYIGGHLRDNGKGKLEYNPGRDSGRKVDMKFTNTKVFLAQWGLNHWGQNSEISKFEAHDMMRPIGVLGRHYIHDLYIVCRTGFKPEQPTNDENPDLKLKWYEKRWFQSGHVGFEWYDTGQRHIVTDVTFEKCGHEDTKSPIWRTLTHSDQFVPEIMQATKNIKYKDCNMTYLIRPSHTRETVANRIIGWKDMDGSLSQRGKPTIIGSNANTTGNFWKLDNGCGLTGGDYYHVCDMYDNNNVRRDLASIVMEFNENYQNQIGKSICSNGNKEIDCPRIGTITHMGRDKEDGMWLTPNTEITGPVLGENKPWVIDLDEGNPTDALFKKIQLERDTSLTIMMRYPASTTFNISWSAASWCNEKWLNRTLYPHNCTFALSQANSMSDFENENVFYYFDGEYLRIKLLSLANQGLNLESGVANPQWSGYERDSLVIPYSTSASLRVVAHCEGDLQCGTFTSDSSGSAIASSVIFTVMTFMMISLL